MQTVGVLGNCQVDGIADCLRYMCPHTSVLGINRGRFQRLGQSIGDALAQCDAIFCQPGSLELLERPQQARTFPAIFFRGFQPDGVYAFCDGRQLAWPTLGPITSAIALYAWSRGASLVATAALFSPVIFEKIGYCEVWRKDVRLLSQSSASTNIALGNTIAEWLSKPPFMYILNHPRLFVLADVARQIASLLDLRVVNNKPEEAVSDWLGDLIQWPVYPGLASEFGLNGDYAFKLRVRTRSDGNKQNVHCDLREYLEFCFAEFSKFKPEQVSCDAFDDDRFRRGLDEALGGRSCHYISHSAPSDPYSAGAEILCDEEALDRP